MHSSRTQLEIKMKKNPGRIVKTLSGKTGRTYDIKPDINGKVQVFIGKTFIPLYGDQGSKMALPVDFEESGILCDPDKLTTIGYID